MTDATNNPEVQATAEATAPAPKLTRREKLAAEYTKKRGQYDKLTAELTDIVSEINSIDALASIGAGSAVVVKLGKGETTREVDAIVIGVREEEDGSKQYKVSYGSGFDADVAVVGSAKLRLPTQVAEEVAAE